METLELIGTIVFITFAIFGILIIIGYIGCKVALQWNSVDETKKFIKIHAKVHKKLDNKISVMDDKMTVMDGKISVMDDKMTFMDDKITVMDDKLGVLVSWIKTNFDKDVELAKSPRHLTDLGEEIAEELGAQEIYQANASKLAELLNVTTIKNAYDLQMACFTLAFETDKTKGLISILTPEELDRAKRIAYKHGRALESILKILAYVVRNNLIKENQPLFGEPDDFDSPNKTKP